MYPPTTSVQPPVMTGGSPTFPTVGNTGAVWGNPKPQQPSLVQKQYQTANAATQQQIGDYMNISDAYKSAIASLTNKPATMTPQLYQTPQAYSYTPSPALTGAVSNLQDLSKTGGYDQQTIEDMRARGVAPVRAAYANAMRQLKTNSNVQGGYSPNMAAAIAKMARNQGQQMSDALTNVNAGIESQVAQGKLAVAPQLAATAGALSDAQNRATNQTIAERNQVDRSNTDITNQAKQFNLTFQPEQLQRLLQGFTGLYGTNPALSNSFMNQALGNAQFQNQMNQQGLNNAANMANLYRTSTIQ